MDGNKAAGVSEEESDRAVPGEAGRDWITKGCVMEIAFSPEENKELLKGFNLGSGIHVPEYAFIYSNREWSGIGEVRARLVAQSSISSLLTSL